MVNGNGKGVAYVKALVPFFFRIEEIKISCPVPVLVSTITF